LCAVADVHTTWNADLSHAEIAETRDDELLAQYGVVAAAWIAANGQVDSDVGEVVAHLG
jgi:hypothetical protein